MLVNLCKVLFFALLFFALPVCADNATLQLPTSSTTKASVDVDTANARSSDVKADESDIFVKSVYADYKAGKYDAALKKIDASISTPEAQNLLKQQQAMTQIMVNNKDRFKTVMKEFETKFNLLKKQRNEQLSEICKGRGDEKICQLVNRIVNVPENQRFNEISTDEDVLLNQDANDPVVKEYLQAMQEGIVKQSLSYLESQKDNNTDEDALDRLHLAIQLSFIDIFSQIAAKHPDHPISKQLKSTAEHFQERAADSRRNNLLRAYVRDNAKSPENMTETAKKVAAALQEFDQKTGELTQQTFSNLNLTN